MTERNASRMVALTLPLSVVALALAGCAAAGPTSPPTAPPPETGLVFVASDLRLDAGSCTTLEWQSQNALKVYLDGRGVEPEGSTEVCPEVTTTYTLSAVLVDGTELERDVTVQVEATSVPPTPTAEPATPTATAESRPTRALASPSPAATPTATAVPTSQVSVEFYPNNYVDSIPVTDLCTSVKWRTTGVTDVELERVGAGRKPVPAMGSEEVCFQGTKVRFILYYRLPDGSVEQREVTIKRQG